MPQKIRLSKIAKTEIPGEKPRLWPAALCLAIALIAAYSNSFKVPFIFDDRGSIHENETIRSLTTGLFPMGNSGHTASGRPLLNFSLAINYALGGESELGYHIGNLLIHFLGSLTLFALVRRTLLLPILKPRFEQHAWTSALLIALIWSLHPIQTESVTYIVQRAESLVGLFYLLTLYCFVRAVEAPTATNQNSASSNQWLILTSISCLCGMASKEVMASAPIIVFLMDRTFVSGSCRKAWTARKKLYVGLALTWLLLLALIYASRSRGGTVAMSGLQLVWHYALTQCYAIIHYLRLSFWPDDLALDYGWHCIFSPSEIWLEITILGSLLGAMMWGVWKNHPAGFLGILFFAVLAPTSSFVPVITQTMAEHRMYLALFPLIALVVLWAHGRIGQTWLLLGGVVLIVALGIRTHLRNNDYRTAVSIWADTAKKRPDNFRAWSALGYSQIGEELYSEARSSFETALKIHPEQPEVLLGLAGVFYKTGKFKDSVHFYQKVVPNLGNADPLTYGSLHNYGLALSAIGRIEDAIENIRRAVALKPKIADAYFSLGNALMSAGKPGEAALEFQKALDREPQLVSARANLGNALITLGRAQEAVEVLSTGESKDSKSAELLYNLGLAEMDLGNTDKATAFYKEALEINPRFAKAHINLGILYDSKSNTAQACEHYQEAIKWGEPNPVLHATLGRGLIKIGRNREGINELEKSIQLAPDDTQLRYFLAHAQMQDGQIIMAARNYEIILRQSPHIPEVRNELGMAYRLLGRNNEAREQFRTAIQLRPDYDEARKNLEQTPQ